MLAKHLSFVKPKISLSKAKSLEAKAQRDFTEISVDSLEHLSELMTKSCWSPILWHDGKRASKNYKSAQFIALDFDSGVMSINQTIEYINYFNLSAIIGTTKSHQIAKISPGGKIEKACDRFRLIFFINKPIDDSKQYSFNLKNFTNVFPCDISCKDSARFFYPCKDIAYINHKNPILHYDTTGNVNGFLKLSIENNTKDDDSYQRYIKKHKTNGTIPQWIIDAFKNGAPIGERHLTGYKIGATLEKLGFSLDGIYSLVSKSPLHDIGSADLERAIKNGFNRSQRA